MPFLTVLLLAAIGVQSQGTALQPADLLFYADTGGMGAAVRASTGSYTHVAMVESIVGDTVWIIDATRQLGVSRRLLPTQQPPQAVYRLAAAFDTAGVLARARSFVGQPYDNAFLPDNGMLYCSELVYECYLDSTGAHLFEALPMNWRTADGTLPPYWIEHFKALGTPVPEGVDGTNPTALSRSPLLRRIQ